MGIRKGYIFSCHSFPIVVVAGILVTVYLIGRRNAV